MMDYNGHDLFNYDLMIINISERQREGEDSVDHQKGDTIFPLKKKKKKKKKKKIRITEQEGHDRSPIVP